MNINREIYNTRYSDDNLRLNPATPYDRRLIDLRFELLNRYGVGKDVLDLCCGTGSYLIPVLNRVRSAVGVDFSHNMLNGFRRNLGGVMPTHLRLVEADATAVPLEDQTIDFVFSYTSLYYVPKVEAALSEVGRVLRPGGYGALELGNLHSLNTLVCNLQHKEQGWAKPFYIPYRDMFRYLRGAGLTVVEWHAFQVLTMYGAPRRLFYLYPLLSPFWKRILGISIGGKMLDEWVSGSWPLRYLAFRHLFLVRKP